MSFAAASMKRTLRLSPISMRQGEAPIEGASQAALVEGLEAHGHKDARALSSLGDLPREIASIAEPGDYVICLGAGDITKHANELAPRLAKLAS